MLPIGQNMNNDSQFEVHASLPKWSHNVCGEGKESLELRNEYCEPQWDGRSTNLDTTRLIPNTCSGVHE